MLAGALGLCLALAAPAIHAQASERAGESVGHLIAFSSPPGAYVYVDGLLLGQTPLRSVALTPGTYSIWFRTNPPRTFEPEPLPQRTFTVVAGDSVLIQQDMGALVRIESAPDGASVTVGGRPAGRTPVEFRWHPKRSGDVRVSLAGYRAHLVREAELRAGGNVRVRLAPLPELAGAVDDARVRSSSLSRFNWRAWGSLTAGVAAAGVAVHLKSRADDAYDEYLGSASPAEQERHLDDSNRLDHLSAISWVVAEGGFIAALWFFARDVLSMDEGTTPIMWSDGQRTAFGFTVRY